MVNRDNSNRNSSIKGRKRCNIKLEKRFIRTRDILYPRGVLSAADICFGYITKEKYTEMVKKNYSIKGKLPNDLKIEIDSVWNIARKQIESDKYLDSSDPNPNIIKIRFKK